MVVEDQPLAAVAQNYPRIERLRELVKGGLTTAEAVDYFFVEEAEIVHTQTEWAEARDRTPQAITQNIRKAKAKLDDDCWGNKGLIDFSNVRAFDEEDDGENVVQVTQSTDQRKGRGSGGFQLGFDTVSHRFLNMVPWENGWEIMASGEYLDFGDVRYARGVEDPDAFVEEKAMERVRTGDDADVRMTIDVFGNVDIKGDDVYIVSQGFGVTDDGCDGDCGEEGSE